MKLYWKYTHSWKDNSDILPSSDLSFEVRVSISLNHIESLEISRLLDDIKKNEACDDGNRRQSEIENRSTLNIVSNHFSEQSQKRDNGSTEILADENSVCVFEWKWRGETEQRVLEKSIGRIEENDAQKGDVVEGCNEIAGIDVDEHHGDSNHCLNDGKANAHASSQITSGNSILKKKTRKIRTYLAAKKMLAKLNTRFGTCAATVMEYWKFDE